MRQQERNGHSALYKTRLEIVAKKIEAAGIYVDDDIFLKKNNLSVVQVLYLLPSGQIFLIVI